MREVKFACPVCGQHITADARSGGGQIECPTCFRKIVVPHPPASEDTKFILAAKPVSHHRPVQQDLPGLALPRKQVSGVKILAISFASTLVVASALVMLWRGQLFHRAQAPEPTPAVPEPQALPAGLKWSLDLANVAVPQTTVSGRLNGERFACTSATLQGGRLTLAQGNAWPPDLGLSIAFYVQEPEKLVGRSLEVTPDRVPPLPRVVVRWKDAQQQPVTRNVHSGYALKLRFEKPRDGRVPGSLYLALPDAERSVIAGTFDAEIRAAEKEKEPRSQTKPKPPTPPPGQK